MDLQMFSDCQPKTLICWLSIVIRWTVWSLFGLSNIIAWGLSGFTTILFFSNQSMATSDSNSNVLINLVTVVANADRYCHLQNYKEILEQQKKDHLLIGWKNLTPRWNPKV